MNGKTNMMQLCTKSRIHKSANLADLCLCSSSLINPKACDDSG